jgi:hypothetical protein
MKPDVLHDAYRAGAGINACLGYETSKPHHQLKTHKVSQTFVTFNNTKLSDTVKTVSIVILLKTVLFTLLLNLCYIVAN